MLMKPIEEIVPGQVGPVGEAIRQGGGSRLHRGVPGHGSIGFPNDSGKWFQCGRFDPESLA